ncbi:MAG: hypothetical protein AB7O28_17595 [Vicinamibacterales bacterium]
MPQPVDPGLCGRCRWHRLVPGAVSTFWMCTRSLTDPAFPRYPRLPVRACRGFDEGPPGEAGS